MSILISYYLHYNLNTHYIVLYGIRVVLLKYNIYTKMFISNKRFYKYVFIYRRTLMRMSLTYK